MLLAIENKGTSQFALPPIDESGGMAIEDGTPPGTPPAEGGNGGDGAIVPAEEDWRNQGLDLFVDLDEDKAKKEDEEKARMAEETRLRKLQEEEDEKEYPYYFDEVMAQYYDPDSGLYYDPNAQEWYDPYEDDTVKPKEEGGDEAPPPRMKPKSLGTTVAHMRGVKDKQKGSLMTAKGSHGHTMDRGL